MSNVVDDEHVEDMTTALLELRDKSRVVPNGEYCLDLDHDKPGMEFVNEKGSVVLICPKCLAMLYVAARRQHNEDILYGRRR